jgi:hypothetical protein
MKDVSIQGIILYLYVDWGWIHRASSTSLNYMYSKMILVKFFLIKTLKNKEGLTIDENINNNNKSKHERMKIHLYNDNNNQNFYNKIQ